jgi:hypothetical protein
MLFLSFKVVCVETLDFKIKLYFGIFGHFFQTLGNILFNYLVTLI